MRASKTEKFILLSASLRYAIPRKSYALPVISGIIQKNAKELTKAQLENLLNDLSWEPMETRGLQKDIDDLQNFLILEIESRGVG